MTPQEYGARCRAAVGILAARLAMPDEELREHVRSVAEEHGIEEGDLFWPLLTVAVQLVGMAAGDEEDATDPAEAARFVVQRLGLVVANASWGAP